MASKPQTFSRMEFSLVIYWVLKQVGLACRPAPPCLVLPRPGFPLVWSYQGGRLRGHILGPSLPYTYVNDSTFHPSFKEGAHPRLGSSSTTRGSLSHIACQADWAWLHFCSSSARSPPPPTSAPASEVQVPRTHLSPSAQLQLVESKHTLRAGA